MTTTITTTTPNFTDSVAIESFALTTPLGYKPSEILDNALAGSLAGMRHNTHYLQGRTTVIGQVTRPLPALPPLFADFDYRANRLLAAVIGDLANDLERLKSRFPAHRIGVVLATSTAGVDSLETALPTFDKTGQWAEHYRPHHQRMGSVSEFVAAYLGVNGPTMTVSTACSSGNKAFASARRWLNAGLCDAVLCGGVDVLSQLTLRGFEALGALSSQQTQPFSKNRAGINIGEGAGLFILSKADSELRIFGCGESADAYHISAPNPNGDGAVVAMQMALSDANLSPEAIDYLNLHGTGTPQNDPMEATAIHRVFGDCASAVACSSSKAQIGHTLGVSGVLELGLALLSMSAYNSCGHYLPHCFDGDYDSDIQPLNVVSVGNALGRPRYVLSNSFAFGGSNATVIIGRE